jgi:polyisoprenyl-phosphate glycosyltransferase
MTSEFNPPNVAPNLCSIILPVFNEEIGIKQFHESLVTEISTLTEVNFELLYVDDGSIDQSFNLMDQFSKSELNYKVRILKLSRNFGHQSALLAGMQSALGEMIITMDSDGQDPPNVIAELIKAATNGYDVVYAQRKSRSNEAFFKKFTAFAYYRLLNLLSEVKFPVDTGDFRLLSRRAKDAVIASADNNLYLRGLVSWVGFSSTSVYYDRKERSHGETKFTLNKMITLALNGITNFSTKPLKLSLNLSALVSVISLIFSFYLIAVKIISPEKTIPGYTTLTVLFLWSLAIQLFCIGLISEYLAKNIQETRRRPHFIVEDEK